MDADEILAGYSEQAGYRRGLAAGKEAEGTNGMNILQRITHDAYTESEALGLPRSATHAQRMAAIEALKNHRHPRGMTQAEVDVYYEELLVKARADHALWHSN